MRPAFRVPASESRPGTPRPFERLGVRGRPDDRAVVHGDRQFRSDGLAGLDRFCGRHDVRAADREQRHVHAGDRVHLGDLVRVARMVDAESAHAENEADLGVALRVEGFAGRAELGRVVGRHHLDGDPLDQDPVPGLHHPHGMGPNPLRCLLAGGNGDDRRARRDDLLEILDAQVVEVFVRHADDVRRLRGRLQLKGVDVDDRTLLQLESVMSKPRDLHALVLQHVAPPSDAGRARRRRAPQGPRPVRRYEPISAPRDVEHALEDLAHFVRCAPRNRPGSGPAPTRRLPARSPCAWPVSPAWPGRAGERVHAEVRNDAEAGFPPPQEPVRRLQGGRVSPAAAGRHPPNARSA
ncbi:MAG: hypothetical protein MZV64_16845 [Ignavibacteriales bacterium]|nr:hypothetical protein [Ignavibacteriales bacterium]